MMLLISSCIRTKTVQVPVPVKPTPCKVSATPDPAFPIEVLEHEKGCPAGFVCISSDSAVATGLYIRDSKRVFEDIHGCPYVAVDPEALGTALDRWLNSGKPLPTK